MKKLMYIILITLFTNCSSNISKNDKYDLSDRANLLALNENVIGLEYIIKKALKDEIEEYHVKYLGKIKKSNGSCLKFITNVLYCGKNTDSPHANAALYVYNDKNIELGYYSLGPIWSLPSKIVANNLVFDYSDSYCNQKTIINFQDSIPSQIYIKCTEKGGDIYVFNK